MARPVLPGILVISAGILSLLGGLVFVGTGGFGGILGTSTGAVIIVVGVLIPLFPARKELLAFTSFVLAVPSVVFSLGGFIAGVFLLLLGGVLTYVWEPPTGTGRSPS